MNRPRILSWRHSRVADAIPIECASAAPQDADVDEPDREYVLTGHAE